MDWNALRDGISSGNQLWPGRLGSCQGGCRLGTAGFDVWAEVNNSGTLVTCEIKRRRLERKSLRPVDSAGPAWLLTDYEGSVVDVTNGSGALQEKVDYGSSRWNMTVTPEAGGGSLAVGDVTWTGQSWDLTISMFEQPGIAGNMTLGHAAVLAARRHGVFGRRSQFARACWAMCLTDATDPSGLFPFTQPLSSNTPKQSDGTYDRAAVAAYQQSSNWQGGDLWGRDPDGLYLATLFNANNAQKFPKPLHGVREQWSQLWIH